jgi:glycosyltransferase involved in cell wall biosynthesis
LRRLSAVLITRNEERDIGRTLDALSFVDEVVVVDSGSTDRTVELCTARGARVVSQPFLGYGPQKRLAVSLASNDWVLCVDADEVVTPELARSIQDLLSRAEEPPAPAYRLPFRPVFMGHPLVHGARETHVRLFDRRRANWDEAQVHESVVVDGAVGTLRGFVLHETAKTISESLEKLDRYTTRAAEERRGRPLRGALALLVSGAFTFFKHYVLRRNFLNGVPGFTWSMLFAVGSVVKYAKGHERPTDAADPSAGAAPAAPPARVTR